MDFTKIEVIRALEQFKEYSQNVLDSSIENYPKRLNQMFDLIEKNSVLKYILIHTLKWS